MSVIEVKVGDNITKLNKQKALRSSLIKDLIDTYGDEYIVELPDKYHSVFNIYVASLENDVTCLSHNTSPHNTSPHNTSPHVSQEQIQLCFDLEAYIDDHNFFEFLVNLLLYNWTELSLVIQKLPTDIQREVLLCCPLPVIPIRKYFRDETFIKRWLKSNKDKEIVLVTKDNYQIYFYGNRPSFYYLDDFGHKQMRHGEFIEIEMVYLLGKTIA